MSSVTQSIAVLTGPRPILTAIMLLSASILLGACGGSDSSPAPYEDSQLLDVSASDSSSVNNNLWNLIDTLPYENLSNAELAAVAFMREEEKLARDVYLDIYDLQEQLAVVDNQDVTVVFESLQMSFRNHWRAFYTSLDDMNITYTPIYISQQEYDEIVISPMECGR